MHACEAPVHLNERLEDHLQLHSLAHGVILLEHLSLDYGAERRRVQVMKMRGARFAGEQVQVELAEPRDGRRKLHVRLLGIDGATGREQLHLRLLVEAPPRRGANGKPARATRAKTWVEGEALDIALADVEKARLVPVLEFRSKR